MSQSDLLLLLPLGWQNYLNHLNTFAGYKRSYTTGLATAALARLELATRLPDEDARGADPERTRGELLGQGREFVEIWQLLEGYIETAYPGAVAYKAMREAAGYRRYEAAANNDWSAMTALIASARQFVALHADELKTDGEMPDDFAARLEIEASDVEKLIQRFYRETEQAEVGTSARVTALLGCLEEFMKVSRDAQRLFLRQPEVAQQFQVQHLLGIVSGTGQAGVRGALMLADGAPAPGVTVEVPGRPEPTSTVSDADGRYALAVPAGNYTLVFSGTGYVRQEVAVTVEAGVKKRVDVVVGKVS